MRYEDKSLICNARILPLKYYRRSKVLDFDEIVKIKQKNIIYDQESMELYKDNIQKHLCITPLNQDDLLKETDRCWYDIRSGRWTYNTWW